MKLTIFETGAIPEPLSPRFPGYPQMFGAMFARAGAPFAYETVKVGEGAPLPDPATLDAVLITGSSAGVYDPLPWIAPLRAFIQTAYAQNTRMVGICFGHQIIADALGGEVRKSEKGWGLGRHTYGVSSRTDLIAGGPDAVAVACSHQDQVITPPRDAAVVLSSDFTPNAGLAYGNGATLSFQPHPEFEDSYAHALIDLRAGLAPAPVLAAARASMAKASDAPVLGRAMARFLLR